MIAAHLTAVVSPLHVLIACDTFALPGDFILLVCSYADVPLFFVIDAAVCLMCDE